MNSLIPGFIRHAFEGIESLPAKQRADHYEAASELLRPLFPKEAEAAMNVASSLREVEAQQLHFRNLFNETGRAA